MSLNGAVSSERVRIGFFGMCNVGKSSLVNAVTGQDIAVVSDTRGTTTDPVRKAMELLPIGPVEIIDTPGIDDDGKLGELRIQKARDILAATDIAVLVKDSTRAATEIESKLISLFEEKKLPYVIAQNKSDVLEAIPQANDNEIYVSALTGSGVNGLKDKIGSFAKAVANDKKLVSDLVEPGDVCVLVIPIDESAPKGRIILPQQMTIRDLLDRGCTVVAARDTELAQTLSSLAKKPKLVITDSQAFGKVSKIVPEDIMLTSFSILMARYKGELSTIVNGANALKALKDGDRVLISEGCTHHRQCNDIGTVKMPGWIKSFTGKSIEFDFTSGGEFPKDLSPWALVVHCGGCMLNEKEMKNRIEAANIQGTPMVNYGVAIALVHGILDRSLEPFADILNA